MKRKTIFWFVLITTMLFFIISNFSASASTLDAIKKQGKLLAGVKYDTVPFGLVNEKNEVVGFDIDLVKEIAKAIGVKVELVSVTSPTRIPLLVGGNVDLVAASMTHTVERDKTIDFSITYYVGGQSLLVRKDSPIKGVKDLEGKVVAVQQGTTLEQNIKKLAPGAKILAFKDYSSAWLAVQQGRADAFTGSHHILLGFAKDNKDYRLAGGKFSVEPFAIGVRQGDSEMRDLINRVLQDLWKTGKYHEIYKKWFGTAPDDFEMEIWP